MPKAAAANTLLNGAGNLLGRILQTRLQRKAKSVILSSLEFLIVDLAVLVSALQLEFDEYKQYGVYAIFGGSALYVVGISIFLFAHAMRQSTDSSTTKEVETSYSWTNKIPILDGILELPLPIKFRGNMWYLPYLAWLWMLACIGGGGYLFGYLEKERVAVETQAALCAAALILYQITSDFSEYWVQSRPHNQETDIDSEMSVDMIA